MGVAQADYGRGEVALMSVSAARHHGAIPRALGVAVVAVPKQRPRLESDAGRIVFVKRDVQRLDLERVETQLTPGWVTTIEQTLLDLAARPALGDLQRLDVEEAIKVLSTRADRSLLNQLAQDQHRPAALATITALADRADA
jgi:hypothetical protein